MRIPMKSRTMALLLLGFLAVGAAAWAAQPRDLSTRLREILASIQRSQPGVRASSTATAFYEVDILNAANLLVGLSGSDSTGSGINVVYDSAGVPSAATLVDTDGSGVVVTWNSTGAGGYALHGTSGLMAFGGDVAEVFPTRAPASAGPGSVMSMDPERPGQLRLSAQPYDRRVAGVVSGARSYRPAVTLRGTAKVPQGVTVTLTGTVYCLASDANGPVRVGDLLTTSAIPGYAMRATDAAASRGAILGKAMEDLQGRRGLVLALASLQ